MKKVAIIGAGISGLSTANAVERLAAAAGLDVEVTVFEREERTGGKIWSIKEEGYLCEWGPNGFLDSKPMTLDLCEHLGIRDRLERSNDNARKRFIYSGGILNRLPENGPMFLQSKLISWPGKFRLAQEFIQTQVIGLVEARKHVFAQRCLDAEAFEVREGVDVHLQELRRVVELVGEVAVELELFRAHADVPTLCCCSRTAMSPSCTAAGSVNAPSSEDSLPVTSTRRRSSSIPP